MSEKGRLQSILYCAEIGSSGWKAVLRSRLLAGRHVRITAVKKRRRQMSPATHSITSSARPSRESGTVRPSALVVSGLINSTFVDSWTGRSAGFSRWRREIEVDPEPGLRSAAAAECRNLLSDRRPYPSPAHTASSTSSDIAFFNRVQPNVNHMWQNFTFFDDLLTI